MNPNNKPEDKSAVKEIKQPAGTAAHAVEGPKTKGGLGPRTSPIVSPTKPVLDPQETPKA